MFNYAVPVLPIIYEQDIMSYVYSKQLLLLCVKLSHWWDYCITNDDSSHFCGDLIVFCYSGLFREFLITFQILKMQYALVKGCF